MYVVVLQWSYIPLLDNPNGASIVYYVAVETSVTSSKAMTSSVYVQLIGKNGSSGTRKLEDGTRQVCSIYILTQLSSLLVLVRFTVFTQSLVFCVMFCRSLFVYSSFCYWPLFYLPFFYLLLTTLLVSSNVS